MTIVPYGKGLLDLDDEEFSSGAVHGFFRNCIECEEKFEMSYNDVMYCSGECAKKNCSFVPNESAICIGCGKEYIKKSVRQEHCTVKCGKGDLKGLSRSGIRGKCDECNGPIYNSRQKSATTCSPICSRERKERKERERRLKNERR